MGSKEISKYINEEILGRREKLTISHIHTTVQK